MNNILIYAFYNYFYLNFIIIIILNLIYLLFKIKFDFYINNHINLFKIHKMLISLLYVNMQQIHLCYLLYD